MATATVTRKPANFLINFWDILTAPNEAFRRISAVQPKSWWFPALLSLIAPILHVYFTMDLQIERMKKVSALQLSNMTPEQADAARPVIERMAHPNAILLSSLAQVVLGLLVAWGIAMLILYFGIALTGSSPKTNGLWAAIAWSWTPLAIRPLWQLVWNLSRGALIKYPGVSYWVATGKIAEDQRNPLFLTAAQLDFFALWHLILVYLLIRIVGKLGRGSSLLLTLVYAFVQLGIRLLPLLLTTLSSAR